MTGVFLISFPGEALKRRFNVGATHCGCSLFVRGKHRGLPLHKPHINEYIFYSYYKDLMLKADKRLEKN